MLRNKTNSGVRAARRALTLITMLVFSAGPAVQAASPEPLPPPPELLDGEGYGNGSSINLRYGGNRPAPRPVPGNGAGLGFSPIPAQPNQPVSGAQPGADVYDPYSTPVSNYLPPLPGQPSAEVGNPYSAQSPWLSAPAGQAFSVPHIDAPPMANLPYDPARAGNRPPMMISPPSANMPDEYFNLPFPVMEAAAIPGVLLPELDEEFYDPGMGMSVKRPIRIGMSPRQLEPFFELAKGFEKSALEAKEQNDGIRYQEDLKKAVDGYMEIIAMADASHEAREEAWYGVARCEYRRENWWKAFDAVERSFPGKFDKREVEGRIKLEMFIAERLWRVGGDIAPDARKDGTTLTGYQAASRVYAAAVFNQPNAKEAPLALLRRGDAAAMDGDWKEAAKFYRTVVQYYPESEPAMQARSSLAESVYRQEWPAGFPEAARDDLASVMTEVETTERKLSMPAEERRQRAVTMANTHEAEQKLRQAKDYMQKIRVKKSRDAAVFQLGEIVSHYPNTPSAREAADLLREMGIAPPMVLSDGTRYPIPSGGRTMLERVANQAYSGGGSVGVGRQTDRRGSVSTERQPAAGPDGFAADRGRPQPRQGNFSPAPELAQTLPPQGTWPSPQINLPPRPGFDGQGQSAMPPDGYGQAPGTYPPMPQQPYQQQWQGNAQIQQRGYPPVYESGYQQPQQRQAPVRVDPRPEDVSVPGIAPDWE